MEIKSNILKHYLRNVMFINGTAYAGKSTMCKMLAKKYDLIHCEENYNSDVIFKVITQESQPNLNYFNTKKSWAEYLNRSPREYQDWIDGNTDELIGFELAELIRISADKKVIVDTNLPIEVLTEIADYNQVAIMLSPKSLHVDKFFDRDDEEKQFLKKQISMCEDPEKTMENFKAGLELVHTNSYNIFLNSGFFIIERKDNNEDTKDKTRDLLANHFGLSK